MCLHRRRSVWTVDHLQTNNSVQQQISSRRSTDLIPMGLTIAFKIMLQLQITLGITRVQMLYLTTLKTINSLIPLAKIRVQTCWEIHGETSLLQLKEFNQILSLNPSLLQVWLHSSVRQLEYNFKAPQINWILIPFNNLQVISRASNLLAATQCSSNHFKGTNHKLWNNTFI